jgi:5-methylcytosine-specific restriction protein A
VSPSGKWASSRRRAELPADWPAIRRRIFERDGWRCTEVEDGERCVRAATDCDHVGDKHDHGEANLTSLCGPHHDAKSAQQGVDERRRRREAKFRPPPMHPGRIL